MNIPSRRTDGSYYMLSLDGIYRACNDREWHIARFDRGKPCEIVQCDYHWNPSNYWNTSGFTDENWYFSEATDWEKRTLSASIEARQLVILPKETITQFAPIF